MTANRSKSPKIGSQIPFTFVYDLDGLSIPDVNDSGVRTGLGPPVLLPEIQWSMGRARSADGLDRGSEAVSLLPGGSRD